MLIKKVVLEMLLCGEFAVAVHTKVAIKLDVLYSLQRRSCCVFLGTRKCETLRISKKGPLLSKSTQNGRVSTVVVVFY